jgi:chromosome partitioning protein
MHKIAVAMSKGGVGKTTTAVNVAAGLAARGRSTLLIDTDTQGQAAKALGVAPTAGLAELVAGEATPTEAVTEARPGLYLLAGGQALAGTKREMARRDYGAEHMLTEALEPFRGRVAYVVVDTGPGWDSLLVNVLFYVEELLCPVSLEGLAVAGLVDFVQRIEAIRNYRQGLELRYILPTGLDRRTAQSGEILEQLESHFRGRVLEPIPYNVRLSEAAARGLSIQEYAPGSTGATAYERLVDTLTEQEEREHGRQT